MAMGKRKLLSKSKTKKIKKTAAEKTAQKKETKENRAAKREYNKAYYRKNRTTILARAKARRARFKAGNTKTTRRASSM